MIRICLVCQSHWPTKTKKRSTLWLVDASLLSSILLSLWSLQWWSATRSEIPAMITPPQMFTNRTGITIIHFSCKPTKRHLRCRSTHSHTGKSMSIETTELSSPTGTVWQRSWYAYQPPTVLMSTQPKSNPNLNLANRVSSPPSLHESTTESGCALTRHLSKYLTNCPVKIVSTCGWTFTSATMQSHSM